MLASTSTSRVESRCQMFPTFSRDTTFPNDSLGAEAIKWHQRMKRAWASPIAESTQKVFLKRSRKNMWLRANSQVDDSTTKGRVGRSLLDNLERWNIELVVGCMCKLSCISGWIRISENVLATFDGDNSGTLCIRRTITNVYKSEHFINKEAIIVR